MISGTIAGSSSFTVYPLGEITIPRPSYSYYYISYTPSSAVGTMWIRSNSTATPVSYQISSYSGMLSFGNSYPEYLSFESCTWSGIETNIPKFNEKCVFSNCTTLQKADLYKCTSLSFSAFKECSSLSQVRLPVCSYIGEGTFGFCKSLSYINLPMCSYIEDRGFDNCYSLSQVSLPMCEYIGKNAFESCSSLSQVSLPVCTTIGGSAFDNCSSLKQVDLPMCSSIGDYAFLECYSLKQVSLPKCSYIGVRAFYLCTSLSQVSLPMCEYIGDYAFFNCTSLSTIIIGYSGVCSLGVLAFYNTKITSSTGSIYVPASLVGAYKTTGEWRQYNEIIQSYPGL